MFLLIQLNQYSNPNRIITLHSTMFLLIQVKNMCSIVGTLIALHSTMFLLIRRNRRVDVTGISTLHSTMFLLIRNASSSKLKTSIVFTFHNVSINTRAPHSPIIHRLFYHFLSTLSFTIILYTK